MPDPPADRVPADPAGGHHSEVPFELLRGLAVMVEPPTPEHGEIARVLGFSRAPLASEYADLFLFQLYPYASVHVGPEGMMGGEARDRVAGFWRALGAAPPSEPDHLSTLVGLYAGLAEREASLEGAERVLAARSRRALLEEHLAPWVFAFLDRVVEIGGGPYGGWAALLGRALRAEWERQAYTAEAAHDHAGRTETAADPALHMRLAPALPDPRADGAAAFVAGLLAPVRSGMILTRADLARIAAESGVALRAGERRYVLEHLIAQDGPAVMRALALEAGRQMRAHREREVWLGSAATFSADRCARTAGLLEALAEESEPQLRAGDGVKAERGGAAVVG